MIGCAPSNKGISNHARLCKRLQEKLSEERIHWPGVHFQDGSHEVAATGAPGDGHHHAENDHFQHGGGHEQTPQGMDNRSYMSP